MIRCKYLFVPAKYDYDVMIGSIKSWLRNEMCVKSIRHIYGDDCKIILCKSTYYVMKPEEFERIYKLIHKDDFKLGEGM